MIQKEESPAPVGAGGMGLGLGTRRNYASLDHPIKWRRILSEVLAGRSLNRFEAERFDDHCLHSTIATIQRKGVGVLRRPESVPGYRGCPAAVCRYTLDGQPENVARALLGEPDSAEDRISGVLRRLVASDSVAVAPEGESAAGARHEHGGLTWHAPSNE